MLYFHVSIKALSILVFHMLLTKKFSTILNIFSIAMTELVLDIIYSVLVRTKILQIFP